MVYETDGGSQGVKSTRIWNTDGGDGGGVSEDMAEFNVVIGSFGPDNDPRT